MHKYDYLIVGGGMTADAAARGIREVDNAGTIGIVSREMDPPYSRPPLSKALWKGDPESSVWRNTGEARVTLHLGRSVTGVDAAARTARDDSGEEFGYGTLLLATGGTPRTLPFDDPDIIYYRTLNDYQRLRDLTKQHERFAVLGGGFIGSEVAAALALNGKSVTMLFPEEGIGSRVYPADLSRFLVDYYREKGVDVRPGVTAEAAERSGDSTSLSTSAGDALQVSAIVAGLGIVPDTKLAESAGLETGNGIHVNAQLRTTREGIFAAGDVAAFPSPALERRLRVEHEDNALTMGGHAGRNMAGESKAYTHLPMFYSDLFDLGYEAVGLLDSRLHTVAKWKEPFREGIVYYLENGRVRGVLLWNVWGKVDEARDLIGDTGPIGEHEVTERIPF